MMNNRKPIFQAIRQIIQRGLKQSEVEALDQAIDRALGNSLGNTGTISNISQKMAPSTPSPATIRPATIGLAGIRLIKQFEGCAKLRSDGMIEAYPDPGSGGAPWTIGWGATGPEIGPGTIWTQAECDARLERDLLRYARDVARALGNAPTTQQQFDAMVSFHYNTGAIARATLTRRHIAGDYAGAMEEFARWNKASGRVLKGLIRRRAAEAKLYSSASV